MSKSIRLSPKHGVNPSLGLCFYCQAETGEVILPGRLKGDKKAPHKAVWDKRPCMSCKEWMRKGVILISVRPGSDHVDPYRTGCWIVLKEAALERMGLDEPMLLSMLEHRVGFVEDDAWDKLGLPREATS